MGVNDLEDEFPQDVRQETQAEAFEETNLRTDDFPTASTSQRVGPVEDMVAPPIAQRSAQNFTLLPRVANVPHWVKKPKDPEFQPSKLNTYKFVDDQVNTNKVNMRKAKLLVVEDTFFKEIVDLRSQRLPAQHEDPRCHG